MKLRILTKLRIQRKFGRVVSLVLLAVTLAALLAGCSKGSDSKTEQPAAGQKQTEQKPAEQKPKEDARIKLGLMPIEDNLPFFVAQSKGYFAQEVIVVEIAPMQSAVDRDSALQAGAIDGGVSDLVAAILLKSGGADITIASLGLGATPEEGRFAILASPKSDITSVSQLKGVEIAISRNSIIEYVTESTLVAQGIKVADIKYTEVPKIPVRFQMLMQGQLKAATLPDPFATLAVAQGARLIADDTKGTNISQTVILFRGETAKKKPETLKKMFAAYARAVSDINGKPDDFRSLLVEKGGLPAPIKDSYKVNKFPAPQLPARADVERVLNWLKGKNLLKTDVSYDQLVTAGLTGK